MLNSEQNLIKDENLVEYEKEFEINYTVSAANVLMTTNFLKKSIKGTQLALPWKVNGNIGICKLPNNEILFWDKIGFILTKNGNIKLLPIERGNKGLRLILYNNYVYGFGGWRQGLWENHAYKFDIKKYRISSIACMPKSSRFCSGVGFKGKIIFTGKDISDLYLYDPFVNSYSEISLDLKNLESKFMFKGVIDGAIYLCKSLLFSSDILKSFDFYNWTFDFNSQNLPCQLISYVAYNENLVYFIDAQHDFYIFDLKLKTLKEIYKRKFGVFS